MLEQGKAHRQQGGADEQAQQAPGQQAADHPHENDGQRHLCALADQQRLEHIVDGVDQQETPYQQEDAQPGLAGVEHPQRSRQPDQQGRQLRHGHDEAEKPQYQRTGHPGNQQADHAQHGLRQGGAHHAGGDAADGAGDDFRQFVRGGTAQLADGQFGPIPQLVAIDQQQAGNDDGQHDFQHAEAGRGAALQRPQRRLVDGRTDFFDETGQVGLHAQPELVQAVAGQRQGADPVWRIRQMKAGEITRHIGELRDGIGQRQRHQPDGNGQGQ